MVTHGMVIILTILHQQDMKKIWVSQSVKDLTYPQHIKEIISAAVKTLRIISKCFIPEMFQYLEKHLLPVSDLHLNMTLFCGIHG